MIYTAKINGSSVSIYKNGGHYATKGGWGIDAAQVMIEGDFLICVKNNGRVKVTRVDNTHGGEFGSLDSAKKWIKQQA